jgi:DNA-binding LacI/PurR family transcriptional regulator
LTRDGPLKMADIARMARVSMSTVSRALAENPLIPREKRLEIQKIAAEAGYVVNQSARSLRLRKTQTVAVVFPLGHDEGQLVSDPFFIEMFGRLADEITSRDHQLLLCRVTKTTEGWLDRIIQSQRQDGIIIVGQSNQNDVIRKAAATFKQMVVWGTNSPKQDYCVVGTDNHVGARRAVEHLVRLKRQKIAFLGLPELPEIGLRYQGYRDALLAAGLAIDPSLLVQAPFSYKDAYSAAIKLIKGASPFDAIFAASDVIALAAIKALTDCGLRTPHDVSVVGFDDIAIAAQSLPPLTTVQQDLELGARTIVDLLFRQMAGEAVESVTLEPNLIIRKSCGASVEF